MHFRFRSQCFCFDGSQIEQNAFFVLEVSLANRHIFFFNRMQNIHGVAGCTGGSGETNHIFDR